MTRASLTAELQHHEASASFHEHQAARHRASVGEIEQQLADMGVGILKDPDTFKVHGDQYQKFPVVSGKPSFFETLRAYTANEEPRIPATLTGGHGE